MKMSMFLSETSMGIEITNSVIRFVQLKKWLSGIEVANYGEKEIPVGRIEYTSSRDKVVLETLRGLLSEKKVKPKNVAVSFPRSSTFFRSLTLPPVKDDVIVPMVNNLAERHLPIRPSKAVFDYDFYEPDRKGMREVILMGAKRDEVMESVNLLKKTGISVVSLEPSTLSSFRLIDDSVQSEEGYITHIFIGEEDSHLTIFSRGRLVSSRTVPQRRDDITGDKIRFVDELCREIFTASNAHDILPGQDSLSGKVFLTCPEEVAETLSNALRTTLGVEVITNSIPGWLQKTYHLDITKYGVSLGLAAASFRKPVVSINLLPQEMKEKRRKDTLTKIWILAGINVILLFVLLGSISLRRGMELSALKTKLELLEPRVKSAERVKQEYMDAITVEESIGEIESERTNWLDLLNDISRILPEDSWLTRIELEKGKPVLLAGMASSAAKLIPVLEESPILEDVKFEAPTTTTTVEGKQVENFRITATVLRSEAKSEADTPR